MSAQSGHSGLQLAEAAYSCGTAVVFHHTSPTEIEVAIQNAYQGDIAIS